MVLIYRLSLWFYVLFIHLASFRSEKAKQWIDGRKGWQDKLQHFNPEKAKVAWFHCASLGEFEQGRPIIEAFKKEKPEHKILLTFFSPSGYEIRKNYEGAHTIIYLPIDSPSHAREFISLVRPDVVYFIKYEFWYFYMRELYKLKTPVYLISAIFRPNQIFFKNYGKWYRKILAWYTHIFVQNETSASLLKSIGIEHLSIAGDTRFDRVASIAKAARDLPIISQFKAERKMIVAGSTWPPDEVLLARYIGETKKGICLVIAPHEIHPSNVARIQKLFGDTILYSEASDIDLSKARVMIIDNIGLLSSIYQYGEIAYVGGAFKTGLHNVLEPACFSMPVLFGPEYSKFQEAIQLVEIGAAIPAGNYEELKSQLNGLLSNPKHLTELSIKAGKFIDDNKGATDMILEKTREL
ncbi:MAG: 3-deoxy-D-manno-octulosonic acid transferase [Bacteroidales bacterium]|nr:3-deoxy-D-manno-octulosonic acid transferase [Bacteroidales bacterium]MCF8456309.1 3-deoxy-D-manno-octulosonic acid transferase [Bacteroidales bacterium]